MSVTTGVYVRVRRMSPAATAADAVELRALAENYAHGADRGDKDAFLSAFHPDARLIVFTNTDDDEPRSVREGHEALSAIPEMLRRYDKTFHFVGNHRYAVDGDTASGEVYCIAHHLTTDADGATDFVMLIRYLDSYRRDPGGAWRIAEREVRPDWTESRRC
jgi:ketosteroid isomerase-like protein